MIDAGRVWCLSRVTVRWLNVWLVNAGLIEDQYSVDGLATEKRGGALNSYNNCLDLQMVRIYLTRNYAKLSSHREMSVRRTTFANNGVNNGGYQERIY